MKYDIDDKARLVLKHIVYIAERTAKQIQFCFTKGKKQYYISPKRDIFLTFNLQSPIDFDYPIPDLNHFLSSNIKTIDSQKLITNKDNLFLPTDDDIKEFESGKLIDIVDFPLKDVQLLNSSKTNKFEFINFISIDKKLHYLFQNHIWDWWRDEDNKLIVKRSLTDSISPALYSCDKLSKMSSASFCISAKTCFGGFFIISNNVAIPP